MAHFTVTAHACIIIDKHASIEIEAETKEQAREVAREMDRNGELPWRETSSCQIAPTDYAVDQLIDAVEAVIAKAEGKE